MEGRRIPYWGWSLFGVAAAVIASHVMLAFRLPWRSKGFRSVSAAIIAGWVMLGFWPPHRQFDLFHANLSGQWLIKENLRKADLGLANLRDANLSGADLNGADLRDADLSGADLSGTDLRDAKLTGVKLSDVNLSRVLNLTQTQLDDACGNSNTQIGGLTIKACSTD